MTHRSFVRAHGRAQYMELVYIRDKAYIYTLRLFPSSELPQDAEIVGEYDGGRNVIHKIMPETHTRRGDRETASTITLDSFMLGGTK